MNIARSSATLSIALALAACVKTEQKPADSTAVTATPIDSTTTTTVTTSNTQTSPPTQPPGGVATPSDVWVVTDQGIGKLRAGMTVAEAKVAVPGGHYLSVAPPGSKDRIVFETDGKRVTTYRAGAQPQVDYVEGCG